MRSTMSRALAAIGFLIPAGMAATITWFMVTVCMPASEVECPLAGLTGVTKGLAFAGVMVLCGGLLAFAFTNLDSALGIAAITNGKHEAKGAD